MDFYESGKRDLLKVLGISSKEEASCTMLICDNKANSIRFQVLKFYFYMPCTLPEDN